MKRRSRWRGVFYRLLGLAMATLAFGAASHGGFARSVALFVVVSATVDFGVHLLRPRWWGLDPELERVTNEAIKLERKDPAAAAKLLDTHFLAAGQREAHELAELKARAPSDRRAARELVRRLEDMLGQYGAMRERLRKNPARYENFAGVLHELEVSDAAARDELARAEMLLEQARLSPN